MNYNTNIRERVDERTEVRVNTLVRSVYFWMCTALLMTGATATLVAGSSVLLETILTNRILFFGIIIAQFGLVWAIVGKVNSFSLPVLSGLFMLYSVLTGVTLSILFVRYTSASIASTFFITAGTFAVMSVYGYFTKTDLTKMGNMLGMALIGIVIASVVNIFMQSSAMYWIISYVGVAVFTGLIAYDTQKIKALAYEEDNEHTQKLALCGALSLYLDFINLFIMLLRILGDRK